MNPSSSHQGLKQTSSGDELPTGNPTPLRQRLSLHFRSFSSANSLSSLSTRSVSTKSIKLKNSNSLWASVSAKAHHVFTRSNSSHSLRALDSGLSHSPTLALAFLSTKCSQPSLIASKTVLSRRLQRNILKKESKKRISTRQAQVMS